MTINQVSDNADVSTALEPMVKNGKTGILEASDNCRKWLEKKSEKK